MNGLKSVLIIMSVAFASVTSWALTETVNGIKWTYTVANGKASIGDETTVAISTSTTGAVTIPSTLGGCPVTSISYSAFYNCSRLTSVMMPDSVTSIGSSAFRGCSRLASVTIPDSVTDIGSYAFDGCSGITNVTIGTSVTNIGNSAFEDCSRLMSVQISDLVVWCKISWLYCKL